MQVNIIRAIGFGETKLGSFDNALFNAGVHNLNLITLSSVLPKGAWITKNNKHFSNGKWGDKLYCVLANHTTDVIGEAAVANITWGLDSEGRGLFVEHHGTDVNKVRADSNNAILDLFRTRELKIARVDNCEIAVTCSGQPVAALVIAVVQEEGWNE